MNSYDIRQSFINFFKDKNHSVVRSSSVAPLDDPTLLFTNAGMNQFKPIFLDEQEPKNNRVINSQKCIRVSGKHNDLEEVGVDTYHHTFFEMLGNWSFGDYYKAEAIKWSWELFTEVWKLDKNRLWATVYNDDDEAFELWKSETDIAHDRILRFGKKENFWEMGETGPCGPCSEIHYYIGRDLAKQSANGVNATDEYWELWNLVFIQFNCDETGKLTELPKKHIDTGAGLERIVTVLQGKVSNYETDLFQPIIHEIEKFSEIKYFDSPVPYQVIADHIRMLTFAIADGVMPSREGRGYIVRRILRRASRFGRELNLNKPFIYQLVETVGQILGKVYPEIIDKKAHIINVIKAEEKSFNKTLDRGLSHFNRIVNNLTGKIITGEEAFKLYDTYGFPLDLTQLMAREKGLKVDVKGFQKEMEQQVARAKSSGKFKASTGKITWNIEQKGDDSKFLGYKSLDSESKITRWSKIGDKCAIVLDQTPFYAESGGQISDKGTIINDGIDLQVIDTQKENERFVHYCNGILDELFLEKKVICTVDKERHNAIKRNHTATHLLHAALKQVLGEHIHQAGSSVGPDSFRFDLTHFEKITIKELSQVETIVNDEIIKNRNVTSSVKSFDEAKKEGAEALFGEKYGDEVRVLTIGKFSKELCGGTHVNQTGDIGLFKIVEESSLAAGVRRVIATTGLTALKFEQNKINQLKDENAELLQKNIKQRKEFEKELKDYRLLKQLNVDDILSKSKTLNNVPFPVIITDINDISKNELRILGDNLYNKMNNQICVLGVRSEVKPPIMVVISQDLVKKGISAHELANTIGGGKGGGKSHMAFTGARDINNLGMLLNQANTHIMDYIISKQL